METDSILADLRAQILSDLDELPERRGEPRTRKHPRFTQRGMRGIVVKDEQKFPVVVKDLNLVGAGIVGLPTEIFGGEKVVLELALSGKATRLTGELTRRRNDPTACDAAIRFKDVSLDQITHIVVHLRGQRVPPLDSGEVREKNPSE